MRRDPKEYQTSTWLHKWNKNEQIKADKAHEEWVPRRRPEEPFVPDVLGDDEDK